MFDAFWVVLFFIGWLVVVLWMITAPNTKDWL
jgi:hypothetical protein